MAHPTDLAATPLANPRVLPLDRRWVILLLAAIVLELSKALWLLSANQAQPFPDSLPYWQLSADCAGGDWWLWRSGLSFRPPGYPWMLGTIRLLTGSSSLIAVTLLQIAVNILTSVTVGRCATRLTGQTRWGWLVYFMAASGLNRAAYATAILTETIGCWLMTICVTQLLLLVAQPAPCPGQTTNSSQQSIAAIWISAVAALTAGLLVRPATLGLLPAFFLAAMYGRQPTARAITVCLLLMALGLLPWSVRNQRLTGRFTLANATGRQLWTTVFSPWPGAGLSVPTDGPGGQLQDRIQAAGLPFDPAWNWRVSSALTKSGLADHEADDLMLQTARQALQRQPITWGRAWLMRCITFWTCWEWPWEAVSPEGSPSPFDEQQHWQPLANKSIYEAVLAATPSRHRWSSYALQGLVWLGLSRLLLVQHTRRGGMVLIAAVLGINLLTAAAEIPVYRYRLVLEPLLMLGVAWGLSTVYPSPAATDPHA